MSLPLASLLVLVYFNAVWQIMLWAYDLLHPILGFMLLLFPGNGRATSAPDL
jgi:hypothetical protein